MIVNLFEETVAVLAEHGVGMHNVQTVLNREGYIVISEFADMAKNITYENGDGVDKIDPNLKIVGSAWWLERIRIDGKEQWLYCRRPKIPTIKAAKVTLRAVGADYEEKDLQGLN